MSASDSLACYNALMASITIEAWKCDLCGHIWIKQAGVIPKQCAKCRTRIWNCDGQGEEPTQMIIEPTKKSSRPIERETLAARVERATFAPVPKASGPQYERPAHAENCACYSCRPPKK